MAPQNGPDVGKALKRYIERLGDSLAEVRVVGDAEESWAQSESRSKRDESRTGVNVGPSGPGVSVDLARGRQTESTEERRGVRKGTERTRVVFGAVGTTLGELGQLVAPHRVWILLDEWSNVPLELQPYLADLLRKSVFPARNITVKIAAIEQRSRFRVARSSGDYLGIELGADAAADVNLDDFMVMENDPSRAANFFRELIFKHYQADPSSTDESAPTNPSELIRRGFTQEPVFKEFVRAAEGVPRDAMYILSLAAQRALESPISMKDVRTAARDWYQRDKQRAVRSQSDAERLLHWIIDEVIGERRARAFLLRSNVNHELVDTLYDARVLHILKRNISAHDQPGVRYDAYKLDYGCYVDLITTAKAPQGLFPGTDEYGGAAFVDVPPDDYRSIRRAILDLEKFSEQSHST